MAKHKKGHLAGKVCVITGGAGLIGRGYSMACAAEGARIVIADTDEKKGKQVAREIREATGNQDAIFLRCDISREKSVARMLASALRRFGRVDALVNNAFPRGRNWGKRFEDVSYEDFCESVNLHLGGYFLAARETARIMQKQKDGIIVNIGSIYGFSAPKFDAYEGALYKGLPMTSPVEYAAIKGGVLNLTRYLASYLGRYHIRVNTLSPGGVFDGQPQSFVRRYGARVVLGNRMARVDDLTGALVFLLSDASRYITGQNLVVDGGWSL